MNIIDLSRIISSDIPVWPSDPSVELKQIIKYGFVVDNILTTCMHIGTHIDAAQHMIEGGKSISEYPPEKFVGTGKLIDARNKKVIDVDLLKGIELTSNDIVLIVTGYDELFGTPEYFENYPVFTKEFTQKLIEHKIKIVGIDSPSPDNHPFPIHKLLLKEDILIIEMLTNLEQLLSVKEFDVIALPPKFDAAGSFIRCIAQVK